MAVSIENNDSVSGLSPNLISQGHNILQVSIT